MKKTIIALAALTLVFSSCLKDKDVEDRVYGMQGTDEGRLIEFPSSPFQLTSLPAANRDTTFRIVAVRLNSNEPAPEDIKVTLVPSPALIGEYNADHGSMYTLLDPSKYSIGSLEVIIPRGEREGYVDFTVNPGNLLDGSYALGFRIASVSPAKYTLSRNYIGMVVGLGVKNKYDGVYDLRFRLSDWDAAYGISNQTLDWPSNSIYLVTSSPNSVNMFSTLHGTNIHVAYTSALGLSGFGSTDPRLIFDESTNLLTGARNDFPNPPNGRTFEVNPAFGPSSPDASKRSRYDPATKTIYAALIMKHPGRTDLAIFDTLTYVGSRP